MLAETVDICIHSISNAFGIVLNSFLIFLIVANPHEQIKTYGFMLLNFAITDLVTCLLAVFLEPRIIPYNEHILYVSNGLCRFIGPRACSLGYTAMLCMYSHINWSLLASFIFRLLAVMRSLPTRRQVAVLLLLFATPTLFQVIILTPYMVSQWDTDFRPLVSEVHPELYTEDLTVFGAGNITNSWQATVATLQVIVPVFPITIVVYLIRCKIIRELIYFSTNLSATTKKMHRAFLQALTLQALTPLLYILGTAMYICGQAGWIHHPITEYGLFVCIGFIPILNPLFSLYYVGLYRNALKRFFCRQKTTESTVKVIKTSDGISMSHVTIENRRY